MNRPKTLAEMIVYDVMTSLNEDNDKRKDDPCWKNYKQVGMKMKNGKEVPNCVPKKKK